MDAAQTLFKKTALFIALALFVMAPGLAAAPAFNNPGTVTLAPSGGSVQISTTADPVAFQATLSGYQTPGGGAFAWVYFTGNSTTACPNVGCNSPVTLNFTSLSLGVTAGTYTATVTLHAVDASQTPDLQFQVQYTSGSGGGGTGTITASPTTLTLFATTGNTATGQVTLTTASVNPISFTVSFQPVGTWLSASSTSGPISSTSSGVVSVVANATGITSNQTGTITITPTNGGTATTINVTLNVTGSGNGTITAFPNPVTLNYTSGGTLPSQFVNVQTTTGAVTYTAIPTSTNNFLVVNGGNNSGTYSNGLNLTTNSNINLLSTGTYSFSVALSDSNGGTGTLTVNVTVNGGTTNGLTFNPSTGLTFAGAVGTGLTGSQTIFVTSTIGGSVTLNCTSTGWLICSGNPTQIASNSQTAFVVSANAAGLVNGTYYGSFQLTVNNGQLSGSVPITFIVGTGSGGGGGGSTGFALAPTSLVFSYQTGTSRGSVARQTIGITGSPGVGWTGQTSVASPTNGTWLNVSTILANFQQDGTGSTVVTIDPTGLAVGSYSGTVTITSNGVAITSQVTLNVVAGPVLLSNPGSVLFNFHTGDPALQPVSVTLTASDNSAVTASATTTTSWLTVSQTSGSSAFSITANPANLGSGLFTGSVLVTQAGMTNSPLTIPVVLIVNGGSGGGGGGGLLSLNPPTLTFNTAVGSSPAAQSITVTASTTTNFNMGFSTTNGGSWLSATQSSSITPATVTVFVNSSTLASGTYNGTITFNANGITQTVSVTLNVGTGGGGGGGNISVDKSSLSFTGQAGAANPAAQTVNITSQSSAVVSVSSVATTTSGGNWLSVSQNNSNTPAVLTVNASTAGLAAGTYNGTVTLTPTGGTTVSIPVTLTVTAPPTVTASPTSLTFTYRAGDPAPAAQTINVSGGGAALTFSATASSNGNWLNVSPTSGTTPAALSVTISAGSLNASATPYQGTITVAGTGTATGTTTITVSLTVTAPLPTVGRVTNAGSYAVATAVSPGEIITLFASDAQHPIGPSTPAGLTLDSTGKVSTTIGGVQVLAAGFACPMIYASASQISAVVPYELAGFVFSGADILVKYLGQSSNAVHVNVATTAPGLFTLNASGTGPGAILNSNSSVNSPSNPTTKGDVIVVYLTGEGQTTPAGVTGKVTTVGAAPQYTPAPLLPIAILIGGQPATYIYAGEAPGFVSGVMQLNVIVPTTVNSGDQPIVVSIGSNSSQSGVTVSIR